jgi:hypothetical protein
MSSFSILPFFINKLLMSQWYDLLKKVNLLKQTPKGPPLHRRMPTYPIQHQTGNQ